MELDIFVIRLKACLITRPPISDKSNDLIHGEQEGMMGWGLAVPHTTLFNFLGIYLNPKVINPKSRAGDVLAMVWSAGKMIGPMEVMLLANSSEEIGYQKCVNGCPK